MSLYFARALSRACIATACLGLANAWAAPPGARAVPDTAGAESASPALADSTLGACTLRVRHEFGEYPGDTLRPLDGLVAGADGTLYGTTSQGGDCANGSVYRIDPDGSFVVLHAFAGQADGSYAISRPLLAADGTLYGTTATGGIPGRPGLGTVWRIDTAGRYQVLHAFSGGVGGSNPSGPLLQARDGNLYGVTQGGGAPHRGVLYRIGPVGEFTVLHSFGARSAPGDLQEPMGALVQAADGSLYGGALLGGAHGAGGIYRWNPRDGESVVVSVDPRDGGPAEISSGLIEAADGALYGVSAEGGSHGRGTLFRLTLQGRWQVLHDFGADDDGYAPAGELARGPDGALMGVTTHGGTFDSGTLFRLGPDGSYRRLACDTGRPPQTPNEMRGPLVLREGQWWGVSASGGKRGGGTVYSIDTAPRAAPAESSS